MKTVIALAMAVCVASTRTAPPAASTVVASKVVASKVVASKAAAPASKVVASKLVASKAAAPKPSLRKAAAVAPKVDPKEVMSQTQGMMAAAQTSLASAERRQEHAVKKAKKNISALLGREAVTLGRAVARYGAEVRRAKEELQQAVNVSQEVLKQEEARSNGNSWGDDPAMEARAQLGATSSSVAAEIRKADRHYKRLIQSAVELGEGSFEDNLGHLSRKVGDLSQEVDEAKASLEAEAAKEIALNATANVIANAATAGNHSARGSNTSTQLVNAMISSLKGAKKRYGSEMDAAEKRFNAVQAGSDKELAAGMKSIEEVLDKKEQANLRKVRAAVTIPALGAQKAQKKVEKKLTPKEEAAQKALIELLKHAMQK